MPRATSWSQDQDGSGWGVYAQRYKADGKALGGEFRVNTTTADDKEATEAALRLETLGREGNLEQAGLAFETLRKEVDRMQNVLASLCEDNRT
jgi:hypothetical protein